MLDIAPLKILTKVLELNYLQNVKHAYGVRFLQLDISLSNPMSYNWGNYKEILDQFCCLEAVELLSLLGGRVLSKISNLPNKEIWNERISYFQKRGIRIVGKNEIFENEALRKQLAKEAGITWNFHFW